MEDILKLIVETDKASRLEVEKAANEREVLTQSLAKIKEEIYSEYDKKAKAHIEKVKAAADEEIKLAQAQIEKNTMEKTAALNCLYEKEHGNWIDHIVGSVISR